MAPSPLPRTAFARALETLSPDERSRARRLQAVFGLREDDALWELCGLIKGFDIALRDLPTQCEAAADRTARWEVAPKGGAVVSTELVRLTQTSHADIAAHVTQRNIPSLNPQLFENLGRYGNVALAYINAEVTKQALFIAYLDDFKMMMIITFAILPLLFFMKRGNKVGTGGPPVHMD